MSVENFSGLVAQLHAEQPPEKTVAGALAFTVRVIRALPAELKAGLLAKPGGENIADFNGVMVSAGRVCFPDGALYKVLTDIPSTNGPQWAFNDTVDASRYVSVPPEVVAPPIVVVPEPEAVDAKHAEIVALLADIRKKQEDSEAAILARFNEVRSETADGLRALNKLIAEQGLTGLLGGVFGRAH